MNKGIIYLVQPTELIGTQRYKMGCSENTELDRVKKGYKKGTRYILIMECYNPFVLEKQIKKIFNDKFKLVAGYEYFEGDETKMKKYFLNTVKKFEEIKEKTIGVEEENNNDDEINDDEINDDEINEYIITTYEEWIKYNKINKIIITNKTTQEGYIRFNNQFWMILEPNSLFECIEKNSEHHYFKNIGYIDYDTKKIMNDILNKCHFPKYAKSNVDNLKYHEYTIVCKEGDYLFNSLNFTFTSAKDINDLLNNKILLFNPCPTTFYYKKNINVDIVNDILNTLVEAQIINSYKKLVFNVLVEQTEEKIIFHDYNYSLLSEWLEQILFSISLNTKYIHSYDYYDDKKNIRNLINKYNIQCVFIHKNDNHTIKKQIKDFSDLGFKYIIVKQIDNNNMMYNIDKYKNFLNLNKENILKIINTEQNYAKYNWNDVVCHIDNIFLKKCLLHTNFLKWCCSK